MNSFINLIPKNYQGKPLDLSEIRKENNLEAALKCYNRAKHRLLNPPVWHQIAGSLSATFSIENASDETPERLLKKGDFISINIHSPEALLKLYYDWVQVKEIFEEQVSSGEAYFLLTLEVATNPKNNEKNIAHFFKRGASSTFVIHQKENKVTALYFGRNEIANTVDENSTLQNVRNEMVALGALAGLSNLQWKAFIKVLLEPEL